MRKHLARLIAFSILVGSGGVARADDQADCRAIIDKAIKAAGGEEKLSKHNAQTWNEKGTYYGMGAGVPYTGKYAVQWPGQFRMEIEGVFTIVLDGDKGWIMSAGGTMELTKEQLQEQKEEQYHGWVTTLLPLKDKAFELKPLGESKVGDRPASGVRVSRKDHRDVNLYFDKDNGLLLKRESRVKDQESGKEVDQVVSYLDYKEVAGMKHPTKIVMKRDGKQFVEAEVIDFKPMEKLDTSDFAKP